MKQYLPAKKTALAFAFGLINLQAIAQAPAIKWDKTFGGSASDNLTGMAQTFDGGYILGGSSESDISGDKSQVNKGFLGDYWIVKVDASGNKQWDRTFGGTFDDGLQSLKQSADGGYILGGTSTSNISGDKTGANKGGSDYWIVKTDGAGNKIWDKTFGGSGFEALTSVSQTSDGGFMVAGWSDSGISGDKTEASKGGNDYWIVKLDAAGNKQWDKTFGGSASEILRNITQTSDGGYIIGGSTPSGVSGDKTQASKGGNDFWLLKLDAAGSKVWDVSFGGNGTDDLYDLFQTADGGYMLGGVSASGVSGDKTQPAKGAADFWVVKLDAAGTKLWDKTFGGSNDDILYSLTQTSDWGYIVGGFSASGISGDKTQALKGTNDYWVVKLDATGNKRWDKSVGGSGSNFMNTVVQTADGGYTLGGQSNSGISGDKSQASRGGTDYWIVRLNAELSTGIRNETSGINISISPNPNKGKFQFQLNSFSPAAADITITDLVGRMVYRQEIPASGKERVHEINLPAIKGIYMLQVKAGNQTTTRKIVVE